MELCFLCFLCIYVCLYYGPPERFCFLWCFLSLLSRVLGFLWPDYCWNRFARVSSSIKNSACFCYCIIRKEMSCHESKISFLSMFNKLKLKNDAKYEGIKWDFLRNFCSSIDRKDLKCVVVIWSGLVWSVPIEFPRMCISVNPRNCTYAFPRICISTFQ